MELCGQTQEPSHNLFIYYTVLYSTDQRQHILKTTV